MITGLYVSPAHMSSISIRPAPRPSSSAGSDPRAAETLRFYQSLTSGPPLPFVVVDGDGRCVHANPRFAALVNRPVPALLDVAWIGLLLEADALSLREALLCARRAGQGFDRAVELKPQDQSRRWVHLYVEATTGQIGECLFVIAAIDVTREHSAHLRMTSIIEAIDDPVFMICEAGLIRGMSPAAERLIGIDRQEAIGTAAHLVLDLIDEDDEPMDVAGLLPQERFSSSSFRCSWSARGRIAVEVLWRRFGAVDASSPCGVLTVRDIEVKSRAIRQVTWEAEHDSLTGLKNRRVFDRELRRAHGVFAADGRNSTLIVLDLDGFKQVNDGGGHRAGDEMLCKVADVLTHTVRSSDLVARIGGDEFAILLHGCSEDRAVQVAETIRTGVLGLAVAASDGTALKIGVSQGISSFAAADDFPDCPLKRADAASYQVKRDGKNGVRVAAKQSREQLAANARGSLQQDPHSDCAGCAGFGEFGGRCQTAWIDGVADRPCETAAERAILAAATAHIRVREEQPTADTPQR